MNGGGIFCYSSASLLLAQCYVFFVKNVGNSVSGRRWAEEENIVGGPWQDVYTLEVLCYKEGSISEGRISTACGMSITFHYR